MKKCILPKTAAAFVTLMYFCTLCPVFAQGPQIQIDLVNDGFIKNLTGAMQLVHAGDGTKRIFIVERAGVIKVLQPLSTTPTVFMDMKAVVGTAGEGGLLSVAFHPQYETNGHFFVYYTNVAGDLEIARYTTSPASGNSAAVSTRKDILTIPHPDESNHNGGELHFGYDDGYLYLSTGDGGGGGDPKGNAQNTASLLGKLLRIDIDVADSSTEPYEVPSDNPIDNSLIYARGLRNPFRWSFDRLTHAIWIGDVGQSAQEEVDYVPAANLRDANFGWRCKEGTLTSSNQTGCPTGLVSVDPIYTYPTGTARGRSVIGGNVYRGSLYPAMYGYYIGMDNSSGQIHVIRSGGAPEPFQVSPITGIVDIGEDEDGELYAVTSGTIYRIYTDSQLPVKLISFSGAPGIEGVKLSWQTSMEENAKAFEVEHSLDAVKFELVGTVPSQNVLSGGTYAFSHTVSQNGRHYYRLKMVDADDTFEYSRIISVETGPESTNANFIRPSLITDQTMNLVLDQPFQSVELVGSGGQLFLKEDITGKNGNISIPVKTTSSGIYIVRLLDHDRIVQQKVLIMR